MKASTRRVRLRRVVAFYIDSCREACGWL